VELAPQFLGMYIIYDSINLLLKCSRQFGRVVKATDSNLSLSVGFARTGSNPVAVDFKIAFSLAFLPIFMIFCQSETKRSLFCHLLHTNTEYSPFMTVTSGLLIRRQIASTNRAVTARLHTCSGEDIQHVTGNLWITLRATSTYSSLNSLYI
jgi:hypothetical protein